MKPVDKITQTRYVDNSSQHGFETKFYWRNTMRAFFIDWDYNIVPYDAEKHATQLHKFVATDEVLVASTDRIKFHNGIVGRFNNSQELQLIERELVAVGKCRRTDSGPKIVGWRSVVFRITTPDELKPQIRELLDIDELDV